MDQLDSLRGVLMLLFTSLWIGLSGAAATVIIRYTPFIRKWVQNGTKPWSCDVCMSLWTSLGFTGLLWHLNKGSWFAFLPAYAVAKWTMGRLMDPIHFPSFDLSADKDEPKEHAEAEDDRKTQRPDAYEKFVDAEAKLADEKTPSQRPTRSIPVVVDDTIFQDTPPKPEKTLTPFSKLLSPVKKDK